MLVWKIIIHWKTCFKKNVVKGVTSIITLFLDKIGGRIFLSNAATEERLEQYTYIYESLTLSPWTKSGIIWWTRKILGMNPFQALSDNHGGTTHVF